MAPQREGCVNMTGGHFLTPLREFVTEDCGPRAMINNGATLETLETFGSCYPCRWSHARPAPMTAYESHEHYKPKTSVRPPTSPVMRHGVSQQ